MSPAVNNGLSRPRSHAYCNVLMMTGSVMRSRNGSDGRKNTNHSSSSLTLMGRMRGEAVRAMRLASVTVAAVILPDAAVMVDSAVARTPETAFDLLLPNRTRSALLTIHVLRCPAVAAP